VRNTSRSVNDSMVVLPAHLPMVQAANTVRVRTVADGNRIGNAFRSRCSTITAGHSVVTPLASRNARQAGSSSRASSHHT
jgi:hypothetical protein